MPDSLNPLIAKCPEDTVLAAAYYRGVVVGVQHSIAAPATAVQMELEQLERHVLRMKSSKGKTK